MANLFIGTSGYNYDHWSNGVFYPKDLAQNKCLEYYVKFFDTVELNVTFYRLPAKKAFQSWYKRTPKNFHFAIKGSRFITHIKKLKNVKDSIRIFKENSAALKEKLSVILWQLPPNLKADIKKLKNFCHDLSTYYKNCHRQKTIRSVRQAFEFRHESWFCDEIYDILKEYNAALVICDYPFILEGAPMDSPSTRPGQKPTAARLRVAAPPPFKTGREVIEVPETADFIYLRRHGATALYASKYSDEQLRKDAQKIKKWLKVKKDVYVYFNNDAHGYAINNAQILIKLLK